MKRKALLHACSLSVAILSYSAIGLSQEYSYQNAYIRVVDGEVSVQRATEPEPEPGELNVPILPGDRVWTHAGSRVEIRFADGTILRLDEGTKVDFVAFDSEPAVLVWSGSVILKAGPESANIRVDSPAGSIYLQDAGTYRVDVHEGTTTTLSVTQGVAELASAEGSVVVRAGQRSFIESGRRPETPFAIDTAGSDAFSTWNVERDRSEPRLRDVPLAEVPDEVHHYVDDLGEHGDWREDEEYGSVWYPSVSVGWAPYRHGRWGYTHYGYTWISYEPWGWAPYHYGRWGYNHYGWYWIPGSYWGPAWVSFAIGPAWVGWSPLGYYGHPVFAYNSVHYRGSHHRYRGGRAVPRHVYDHGAGWNFARSDGFGKRSRQTRLRPEDVRGSFGRAVVHSSGAVLDRQLTPHGLNQTGKRAGALRRTQAVQDSEAPSSSRVLQDSGVARSRARTVSPSESLQRASEIVGRTDNSSVRREAARQRGGTQTAPSSSANGDATALRQRGRSTVFRRSAGTSSGTTRSSEQRRRRTRPTTNAPQRRTPTRSSPSSNRTRTRGDAYFQSSGRRETATRTRGSSSPRQRSTTRGSTSSRQQRSTTRGSTSSRGSQRSNVNRSAPPRGQRSSPGVSRPRGNSRSSGAMRSRGASSGSRSRGSGRSRGNNR